MATSLDAIAVPPAAPEVQARSSPPPTRTRWRVLAAACSVAVIAYVHRVGFAAASLQIEESFHLSSTQLGALMAAFVVAYALFEVPAGLLGDRFGVRHLLTALVLGWSLLTGVVGLVTLLPAESSAPFLVLLALRFLFGMFQAGGFPSLSRMMADWMPARERASALGFIWMSARLGGAVVPLAFAQLLLFCSWGIAVWVLAAVGIVWSLVFFPWFRNRPEEMAGVNETECELIARGRVIRTRGQAHLPWSVLLRSRNVWGLCLMYGFAGFSATFFVTMLPTYLKKHRDLPDSEVLLLTSLPLACGVAACVAGGLISDWMIRRGGSRRWARRMNGAIGLSLAGLAVVATLYVRAPAALAALLCLTFFCNDLNMAPAWASCADIGERYAGTLGGAMNMIGNLFAALMTILSGVLLDRQEPILFGDRPIAGKELLFVILGVSFGLGSLCWMLVDVTQPLVCTGKRSDGSESEKMS